MFKLQNHPSDSAYTVSVPLGLISQALGGKVETPVMT